ncbi:MAG: Ig-like domain-containing protein [candidate division KSB1 bacterium]|nr:Ig-like domain-containing protein [candidate division KSB1 bacterium]MDZ7366883.1 Ig-like domain-containing protein [candidate division KSB1 bacterium]MDZ7406052.1 Ig-like domain-containing protein [candidate division KSB1 bacterium]
MAKRKIFSAKNIFIVLAALIFPGISSTARAQFNVASISPAHGSLNVPTNAAISITFSAALDTSFRFSDTELPVNFELHPDTAFSDPTVTYSSDLRTIRLQNLNLQANTRYVLLVLGARDASRTPLARAATVTFSTGPALPSGSVSGTVSYSGGGDGAVVGVFSALDEGATVGFAIANSNGGYTIPFLPGGSYFALSIKDVNLDGQINPGNVDPIGGYDPDANKLVNPFTLPAGGSLSGINITLRNPTPKTARELYSPAIENIAKAVRSDAQLVALAAGNLGVDGKSTFWGYLFYSPTTKRNFGFGGSDVICFPIFDEGDTLDLPLPADWIDSKVAMDTAQARVGRNFLQKFPNAEIFGFAGPFEFGGDEGLAARRESALRFGLRQKFQPRESQTSLKKTARQPQQGWFIQYTDAASGRFAAILLDLRTGKTLSILRATSALPNLPVAQTAALRWTPDAKLVLVGTPPGAGFSPIDGTALAWIFVYHSTSKDSLRQFITLFGELAVQENVTDGPKMPIPAGWLDTDKTGPTAELLGGASFRQMYPNAIIEAVLGFARPGTPNRLFWFFRYRSPSQPTASIVIYVDALTGVSVNNDAAPPNEFALRPAYPNPIHRGQQAQWPFSAPAGVEARVYICNVLGQNVAQLLEGKLPAGESILRWDGRLVNGSPAASGVYFLRLEFRLANDNWRVMTQPVMLQK